MTTETDFHHRSTRHHFPFFTSHIPISPTTTATTNYSPVSDNGSDNATTFCTNYFDTGAYYCANCESVPSSIVTYSRVEFVLAILVILVNTAQVFVIVGILRRIRRRQRDQIWPQAKSIESNDRSTTIIDNNSGRNESLNHNRRIDISNENNHRSIGQIPSLIRHTPTLNLINDCSISGRNESAENQAATNTDLPQISSSIDLSSPDSSMPLATANSSPRNRSIIVNDKPLGRNNSLNLGASTEDQLWLKQNPLSIDVSTIYRLNLPKLSSSNLSFDISSSAINLSLPVSSSSASVISRHQNQVIVVNKDNERTRNDLSLPLNLPTSSFVNADAEISDQNRSINISLSRAVISRSLETEDLPKISSPSSSSDFSSSSPIALSPNPSLSHSIPSSRKPQSPPPPLIAHHSKLERSVSRFFSGASFVVGDPLTLATFAVCDCLLGEGYLLEISCLAFTGAVRSPVCRWTDRIGVFLIKLGGIYMPTALLNEACIKRLCLTYSSSSKNYFSSRNNNNNNNDHFHASPRFVGVSWAISLFLCVLDVVIQDADAQFYDIYYSTIKYCLLGLNGIFYLLASLLFVIQANRGRCCRFGSDFWWWSFRRNRGQHWRRQSRSMIFESAVSGRQRRIWTANFAVQFFIFFICISIFLSVNLYWLVEELTHHLHSVTTEQECAGVLMVYKLMGITFGLGKPFIFFLGLRTLRRYEAWGGGSDVDQSSRGSSLRTISCSVD